MAALQLFCLPYAGASATAYLRWRRVLPASVNVVPLEPPGRGARLDEPLVRDFETLAAGLVDTLIRHRHRPDAPTRFALFGHSMGGLLAWRLCHVLRERGEPLPERLIVSGCAAPSRRDPGRLATLRGDAALAADLRKHGGTPAAVFADPELLRLTLDVLDADYRVCESFRRQVVSGRDPLPLPTPLHVLAGHDDPISPADLHAWSIETQASHTLDWFAGGHFFLHDSQGDVLRRVGGWLTEHHAASPVVPPLIPLVVPLPA